MVISVRAVKSYTIPVDLDDGRLVLERAGTVADAYERLGINDHSRRKPIPYVNGVKTAFTRQLRDGDDLFLFFPLNGG